jgi:hypothetical protein
LARERCKSVFVNNLFSKKVMDHRRIPRAE